MNQTPSNVLGVTRSYPFPFVHSIINEVPAEGVSQGMRRYFEQPNPVPQGKLARLDVLLSIKGIDVNDLASLTITLVDRNAEEHVRDLPLALLAPIQANRRLRGRYFVPFDWDPMKSFVSQVGTLTVLKPVEFLAYYTAK